jgi:hypothetical protein
MRDQSSDVYFSCTYTWPNKYHPIYHKTTIVVATSESSAPLWAPIHERPTSKSPASLSALPSTLRPHGTLLYLPQFFVHAPTTFLEPFLYLVFHSYSYLGQPTHHSVYQQRTRRYKNVLCQRSVNHVYNWIEFCAHCWMLQVFCSCTFESGMTRDWFFGWFKVACQEKRVRDRYHMNPPPD